MACETKLSIHVAISDSACFLQRYGHATWWAVFRGSNDHKTIGVCSGASELKTVAIGRVNWLLLYTSYKELAHYLRLQ